ncbi:hypothetical protein B0H14DRAFT_3854024 [Mycena olivaceomarginata]|nr:hypothetical protein B0H14DRAFT_3854024 [Mycena olivaceomarginata]
MSIGAPVPFERDRARRTLLLCKKHERDGTWAARRLQRYLKSALEHVTVHEVGDNSDLKSVYRGIAEARFCDIAGAIRAHARLRADPSVRVPLPYPPNSDYFEALTAEPRHPPLTYFPATSSSCTQADVDMDNIYRPFTTVTVSNLPARTTGRRIFGAPDVTFFHPSTRATSTRVHAPPAEDAAADAEDASADADASVDGDEGASADADENANANVDVKDTSAGERADTDVDVSTSVDPNASVAAEDAHAADEHAQPRRGTEYAQLQDRNERPLPDGSLYRADAQPPPPHHTHTHTARTTTNNTRALRLRAYDPALAQRLTRLRGQVAQYGGAGEGAGVALGGFRFFVFDSLFHSVGRCCAASPLPSPSSRSSAFAAFRRRAHARSSSPAPFSDSLPPPPPPPPPPLRCSLPPLPAPLPRLSPPHPLLSPSLPAPTHPFIPPPFVVPFPAHYLYVSLISLSPAPSARAPSTSPSPAPPTRAHRPRAARVRKQIPD